MPSRFVRMLFVLAAVSSLGLLAPGRAFAEPTPEQRAQWIRQIKLSFARRQAENEGLQEAREREARTGDEGRRRAIEAGLPFTGDASTSQEPTDGLRLDAPAWFSLTSGTAAGPAPGAGANGPTPTAARDRATGASQVRVPEGLATEGRGQASPSARGTASPSRTTAAQVFAPNVRVSNPALDDPTRADAQSETAIAAYRNNVLAAWNESRNTGHSPIGYAYSTNNGQTFVNGGYPAEGDNDVLWTSDPVLAVNENTGVFYFCALVDPVDASGGPIPHGVAVLRGTFSGSTFAWDNVPHIVSSIPEPNFIDKPWIAVDPSSGTLYVTYTKFVGGVDSIMVQRSTNDGNSWSAPRALSSATSALVQGSRVTVGPDGEVYVTWKEIRPTEYEDLFRIRKSTNAGVTWGSELTATTLFDNFGTGAPNFNRPLGISFPSIVVDRSSGPRRGRVYLTWNETLDYSDADLDTTRGPRLPEDEPNDSTATATPFVVGQTLIGDFNNADDFDYWSFNAVQGTTYVFWSTSTLPYTMRIFCTDGVTRLAYSGDPFGPFPQDGFIIWTAPTTGTYYLRLVVVEGDVGNYIVWSAVDLPTPTQRARDTRDVFVRSSPDGIDWASPPVRVNTDPVGFDAWLPEIAASGSDLYVAWYDWSGAAASTCGGESNVNLARSDDGGATWVRVAQDLGGRSFLTDQVTPWTRVNSDIIPNQGDYIALVANPAIVYPSWADGRCTGAGCVSTPDVMAASFVVNGLQIAVIDVVVDTVHVAITWQVSGASVSSATLYRRVGAGSFQSVTTLTPDGSDRLFYDDLDVQTSTQYQYRLGVVVNGVEVFLAEQTVQVPGPPQPTLVFEGAFPNPTPGPLTLSFTLPTTETAWLTLFDASGRKLREWDVSSGGAGQHRGFDFGRGLSLEPGVYLVRLRQGSVERTRRVVLLP